MTECRSCGAEIVWASTERGKAIPINPAPDVDGNLAISGSGRHDADFSARVIAGDEKYSGPRYKSHFATCPDSDKWRK